MGRRLLPVAVGLVVVLASLGGPAPAARPSSGNTVQPSGSWTWVRWLKSRSDGTAGHGMALERRVTFLPTCDQGRCTVTVAPDGINGTFYAEGYATVDPPAPGVPYPLEWKAATGTYEHVIAPSVSSCTNADLQYVPDAYQTTGTISVVFTPERDGKPAALRGTYTEQARGIGAGIAGKCTDYDSVWTIAAAPAEPTTTAGIDLAGSYHVTEVVEATIPAEARDPGFVGTLLESSTVAGAGAAYTVTGIGPTPTALTLAPAGWSGQTSAPENCGTLAGGYTRVETWSRLRPVAVTADGKPVLAGYWRLELTSTVAGCDPMSNKGYVLFVPLTAI